jgi:selenocysteine-specific elongation factor
MKHVIVGTAGHIDHGKSALVKALTGTDPDRLEEEKRRGITIDIGFAHLDLPADNNTPALRLGFVDVPGHERFVKNMLAGIGGIDLVLFVVAADESIKPQTREHFDICRLLEVRRGIVALTKCDLVDRDIVELVRLEVEEFVAGSFLSGAPVIPVSSRTGEGLEKLVAELRRLAAEIPAKDSSRHFRLPIDRAFVMKGFGAVVTGTLISGQVEKDSEVELFPSRRRLRVRGIQVHNAAAERALAGQRTALNLAGAEAAELARGMTLAAPGVFEPTERIDTVLHLLPSARPLKHRAKLHFHCGTASIVAEVRLPAGGDRLEPGGTAYAQLLLREPALLLPGDRFIIRQFSPVITIGGGRVLDNLVPSLTSQVPSRQPGHGTWDLGLGTLNVLESGSREEILLALLERGEPAAEAGGLIARTGWLESELRQAARNLAAQQAKVEILSESPLVVAHGQRFRALLADAVELVRHFHAANPLLPGIPKEELRERGFRGLSPLVFEAALARLAAGRKLEAQGEVIKQAGRQIVLKEDEERAKEQIAAAFETAGLAVPALKEVLAKLPVEPQRAQKILLILIKEKTLIKVTEELVFHRTAIAQLRRSLAGYKARSDRINVGAFKELTGITRKYAIPLLEYLDRERVTRRVGDERLIL